MLDNTLIEKALALTGKNIHCMNNSGYLYPESEDDKSKLEFRIEKFCYYLLSPEFIEKYHPIYLKYSLETFFMAEPPSSYDTIGIIGNAVFCYQSGNETPLVDLLKKI